MPVGHQWYSRFLRIIRRPEFSEPLREIATSGRLTDWTRVLTDAVAATCGDMGWNAVAKGHPASFMPAVRRRLHQEYLALDVVAFNAEDAAQSKDDFRWPFPAAVFELENKRQPERIAFSLWKVLMARAPLRVVFCYCRDRDEIPALVRTVSEAVLPGLSRADLAEAAPGLMLVVGTRAKADDFPHGFFHEWVLNSQTASFRRP